MQRVRFERERDSRRCEREQMELWRERRGWR
jgi:hypothetical protein